MNNQLLIERGLFGAFADMSDQPAGELGPRNTADALLHVERASVAQDRHCRLASYSDYCAYLGQPRPVKFSDISSDPDVADRLATLYAHPREVDFHVGLFCEDRVPNAPLPGLVLMFVALDAFSQALTNPLLSRHVFKESTFSSIGWTAIKQTHTLSDIVKRNMGETEHDARIAMTRADWQPV